MRNLRLTPPVPPELSPTLMISGSSEAGMEAARALHAIAIKYPQPVELEPEADVHEPPVQTGMRVGVIAREDSTEAWRVARERFPESRTGQLTQRLASRVSDSSWHRQLSTLAGERGTIPEVYWLGPFENYASFCPYLVGDHDTVAAELARYLALGFSTFVLDIPHTPEDLRHAARAFTRAAAAP